MEKVGGHGLPRLKEPSSTSGNTFLFLAFVDTRYKISLSLSLSLQPFRITIGKGMLERERERGVFVAILVDARMNVRSMNQSIPGDVDETRIRGVPGGN